MSIKMTNLIRTNQFSGQNLEISAKINQLPKIKEEMKEKRSGTKNKRF